MKSIKTTLILSMSISIILILGIIISIVGITTRNNALDQAYKLVEKEAEYSSERVRQNLNLAMDTSRTLAIAFEGLKEKGEANRNGLNDILKNVIKENENFLGVWSIWEPNALDGQDELFANTEGHDGSGRFIPYWHWSEGDVEISPCEDYDVSGDGDYYLLAKNSGEETILEPFIYTVNGKDVLMTSIAVPIHNNGKVIGVVGIDLTLDSLKTITEDVKILETGYAMILSNTGTYVTNPVTENLGSNIFNGGLLQEDEIKTAIKEGKESSTFQKDTITGKEVNMISVPIEIGNSKTPWAVAAMAPIDEITDKVDKLLYLIIGAGLLGTVVLIIILWFISGKVANPIKVLSQNIDSLANYDLSFDEESEANKYLKRKDEIGLITNSLAKMQGNFINLVKSILDTSQQVASSSEELTATSQQSAIAAEEVAKTVEEIAEGASEQAKNSEEGVTNINHLGELIGDDQKHVTELNNFADEVSTLKDDGLEVLKDLVEKTKLSNEAAEDLNYIIKNTNASAGKIEKASQMIKSISEQTNLLALNAAIEAARSGEAGKGFAVVAEEIRKLAEQSDSFTDEISTVIQDLIEKTKHGVNTMDKVGKIVTSQTESVEETNNKFEGIAIAIDKMKDMIDRINKSSHEMEMKKNEMIGIIENFSAISEENAAATEEVSASVEEQTASMEEIANSSEALAKMAEEMKSTVSKFKIQ